MAGKERIHIPHCHDRRRAFFDEITPLISPLPKRLDVDEDFLLALVAFEDAWGQDVHNKKLHNLFGVTQAGGNNIAFSTYEDCVAFWERTYGPKVRGIKNLDDFIVSMKRIGYNSVNKQCYNNFRSGQPQI